MAISRFECQNKNLSLCIFNFDEQNLGTQLKAILTSEAKETKHPVIASIKSINKSVFEDENIESKLDEINLCPGVSEAKVLPLLSHFGNVNFACIMFLIEMVQKEVIYRSRKCEMVTSEDLCKSCQETFQDLKLDLSAENGKENFSERSLKEECCSDNGEEDTTYLACEQVLEEEMIANYGDENCENTFNNLDDVKLEPKEFSLTKTKKKIKIKKFKCDYCEKSFNTSDGFIKHVQKRHSNEPGFSITLQNYIDKEKNLSLRKKHACPECQKKYVSKGALIKHVKKAHDAEVARSLTKNCPFCGQIFQANTGSNHNLYTHIRNIHETDKESSQYQDIVDEYMSNKVICQICGNSYSNNKSLATHVDQMHTTAEFAPCEVCGKSIRQNATSLNSHMKIHKNEIFICPECGNSFAKKSYLQRHMQRHNTNPFPCPECGRLFTTIMKLRRHKRHVHLKQRNFQCEHCEKRFQDSSKMKQHIRSVHTKEKPFGCEMCAFKCARIDNLNLHRRKTHGATKSITQSELQELLRQGFNNFVEDNNVAY